jgi:hypothetical protein
VDEVISPEPDAAKVADATNRLIKTIAQATQWFDPLECIPISFIDVIAP